MYKNKVTLITGFCWLIHSRIAIKYALKPDGFCPNNTLHGVDKDLTIESERTALSLSEQTEKRTRLTRRSKARDPYRRYTAYQIGKLFDLVI